MATASVTNTFTNGTSADAPQVNTNFTDLVTFLNNQVVHRDGTKAFTANQPMGGFKLTGLAAGSVAGDSVRFEDVLRLAVATTKGDIFVATASGVVVRRGVGANGTVLTGDSAEADGMKWATPASGTPTGIVQSPDTWQPIRSGNWFPAGVVLRVAAPSPTNVLDLIQFVGPFSVGTTTNVDQLGFRCTSVGTGFNFRLALYEGHATTRLPDAKLAETASTAGVASTSHAVAITSTPLVAGKVYWLAYIVSASTGTFEATPGDEFHSGHGGWNTPRFSAAEARKFTQAFTYGAMPATATPVASAYNIAPVGLPNLFAKFV